MREAGNLAKSAKLSRKAIKMNPEDPAAYHNLNVALAESGDACGAAQASLQAKEKLSSPSCQE